MIQFSRDETLRLTAALDGDRFDDGRPHHCTNHFALVTVTKSTDYAVIDDLGSGVVRRCGSQVSRRFRAADCPSPFRYGSRATKSSPRWR